MSLFKRILIAYLLILPTCSFAGLITNGNFSSGLANWSTTGSVTVSNEVAQLTTGVGYSPFLVSSFIQGDDGSFSFPDAISLTSDSKWLLFDAKVDISDDLFESKSTSFEDYLTISLFDELDFTGASDSFFYSSVNFNLKNQWLSFALDISPMSGRSVALSFEAFDENNQSDSLFYIDNIRFSSISVTTSVSEPTTLFIIILPVYWLFRYRKKMTL